MQSRSLIIAALFLAGPACTATNVAPPNVPPGLDAPVPLIDDRGLVTYKTTRVFEGPLEPVRWFIEDGSKIVAAMEETDRIRKPIEITVLKGTWPEVGSIRRLKFSDGHFTLERVLENKFPHLFRYQVYAYTSAAGQNIAYAIGQQRWERISESQSKLEWTYSLKPNAFYKKPFVDSFVNSDMKPLMENALDRVKAQADGYFAGANRSAPAAQPR